MDLCHFVVFTLLILLMSGLTGCIAIYVPYLLKIHLFWPRIWPKVRLRFSKGKKILELPLHMALYCRWCLDCFSGDSNLEIIFKSKSFLILGYSWSIPNHSGLKLHSFFFFLKTFLTSA